jgi:hypothetical protein
MVDQPHHDQEARRVQPTDGDVSRRQREQRAKVAHRPSQLAPVELELSDAHF